MYTLQKKITPESLVAIYKALGVHLDGKTLVKISSGEYGGHNFLQPKEKDGFAVHL